jgi:hypothetical protein
MTWAVEDRVKYCISMHSIYHCKNYKYLRQVQVDEVFRIKKTKIVDVVVVI